MRAVIPALTLGALIAIPSFGTPVTGEANVGGNATVTSGGVFFGPDHTAGGSNPFVVGAPDSGSFSGLTGGFIRNLSGAPTTGMVNIPDFAQFNVSAGTIQVDLTNIDPGVGTQAACLSATVGNVCTPTGSPFTLIQESANSVLIGLSLGGDAFFVPLNGQTTSIATGIFSTQNLHPGTIPQILADVQTGFGFSNTFSATFTATSPATTPEPASLLLMGIGLLGAGIVARKKVRG